MTAERATDAALRTRFSKGVVGDDWHAKTGQRIQMNNVKNLHSEEHASNAECLVDGDCSRSVQKEMLQDVPAYGERLMI